MSTKTITLDNGQMVRTSIKKGDTSVCTPLLLMSGIGASLELLSPFVEAMHEMNPDIEVITFDAPGIGGSTMPLLPYQLSGLTTDINQMLNVLGYDKVNVLGLSWGGYVAQQFAHDYRERCSKLILAATSAGILSAPPSSRVLELMSSPRRYTDADYMEKVSPEIYGGRFRTDSELVKAHAKKITSDKSGEHGTLGYAYQVSAAYCWSSLYWLHTITTPTLLLAGDDDPIIALVNMEVLANIIPNSELHVFKGEGHLFLLTSLDKVTPVIRKFLEGC